MGKMYYWLHYPVCPSVRLSVCRGHGRTDGPFFGHPSVRPETRGFCCPSVRPDFVRLSVRADFLEFRNGSSDLLRTFANRLEIKCYLTFETFLRVRVPGAQPGSRKPFEKIT